MKTHLQTTWTYCPLTNAHYFTIPTRKPPPYKTQIHIEAIADIAEDGTLAGIEIIDSRLPPPPETADD